MPSQRSFSLSGPTVTNLRNHSETVRSANSWLKQKNLFVSLVFLYNLYSMCVNVSISDIECWALGVF